MVDKMEMLTENTIKKNLDYIFEKFPWVFKETIENGKLIRKIDFDMLKQELSDYVLDDKQERYQMTWPDKRKTILQSNSRISSSLRPLKNESKNFDNTKNIYIKGDNLDVLKVLREAYFRKFDVIYIDPPYNTGNNLIYKNDFSMNSSDYINISNQYDEKGNLLFKNTESNGRYHTDWLNMIYPRLRIAKDLLSDDGVIVLTIDDYEVETITIVMNEIFGEKCHLGTIVIKNNPSGRSTVSGVSISHEYALFYGATEKSQLSRLPRNEKQISRYKERDENGIFEWVNFRKHGGYKEDAPTMYYPIYVKKDFSSFRIPKLRWNELTKEYDVLESCDDSEIISLPLDESGRPRRWKWGLDRAIKEKKDMCVRPDRSGIPAVYIKSYMNEDGMLPLTVWDDKKYSSTEYGTNLLINLLGGNYFDYPKSLFAVMDCLRVASNKKNAKILDFFSGSATTANAVYELNKVDNGSREYMMVQYPEQIIDKKDAIKAGYKTICDIAIDRLNKMYLKDNKTKFSSNIDCGFRVFKLDSSNMNEVYYSAFETKQSLFDNIVDNFKPDRTPLDLLFQVMLELGVELSAKIDEKEIFEKRIFMVNENDIVACFDNDVSNEVIKEIAMIKPIYAVFRDSVFENDAANINCEQLFKSISPSTTIKVL